METAYIMRTIQKEGTLLFRLSFSIEICLADNSEEPL